MTGTEMLKKIGYKYNDNTSQWIKNTVEYLDNSNIELCNLEKRIRFSDWGDYSIELQCVNHIINHFGPFELTIEELRAINKRIGEMKQREAQNAKII